MLRLTSAQADGWDIRLTCQPPNSPDLNVLDLGFFCNNSGIVWKGTPNNINDIVAKVDKAYQDYPVQRANRIFLTQQGCMMEIMKHNGGQHYNIPHMKKKTLELQGRLPITLKCPLQLHNQAMQFVGTYKCLFVRWGSVRSCNDLLAWIQTASKIKNSRFHPQLVINLFTLSRWHPTSKQKPIPPVTARCTGADSDPTWPGSDSVTIEPDLGRITCFLFLRSAYDNATYHLQFAVYVLTIVIV